MRIGPAGEELVWEFVKASPILGGGTLLVLFVGPRLLLLFPQRKIDEAARSPSLMLTWNLLVLVGFVLATSWWITQRDIVGKVRGYLAEIERPGEAAGGK